MKIRSALGEYSGSMGDITASRNKGGQYFRFRARPTNPQTGLQTAIRAGLSSLSKAWGATLTAAQRAGWKVLGDTLGVVDTLGESRNLSGNQWFVKINGRLLRRGLTALTDAPIDQVVTSSDSVEISNATGGGNTFDVAFSPALGADEYLSVDVVINQSPGKENFNNLRRYAAISAKAASTPVTITLPTRFGNFVTGSKYSMLVQRINEVNGAVSPGIVVNGIAG